MKKYKATFNWTNRVPGLPARFRGPAVEIEVEANTFKEARAILRADKELGYKIQNIKITEVR